MDLSHAHPLDTSDAYRRLLQLTANVMLERMYRKSKGAGERFAEDEVLGLSVGLNVEADGRASYVVHQWFEDFTGHLLIYGTISPMQAPDLAPAG